MRRLALACALALLATACSAKTASPHQPQGNVGGSISTGGGQGGSTPRASGSSHPLVRTGSGAARQTGNPAAGAVYSDDYGVGAMSLQYLRSAPAKRLLVEVDYVDGFAPTQAALDHLATVLRRETEKSDGVDVVLSDKIPNQRSSYTFDQIDGLERRYRQHYSGGSTATIWLVYLNGQLSGYQGTLGVAYRASDAAIFQEQIQAAATALVQPGAIERAVLVHEVGHLLGLINIGYHSAYDHEDPQHPHHSKYQTSVMYWAIEDVSIVAILNGGPPDDYDKYDRADLKFLRTG